MNAAEALDMRERNLDIIGPRDASMPEIARWVLALALRRDGRADAVTRADEIVQPPPAAPEAFGDREMRERGAVAASAYLLSTSLAWPVEAVARMFGLETEYASGVIEATCGDLVSDRAFRAGFSEIALCVRAWSISAGRH